MLSWIKTFLDESMPHHLFKSLGTSGIMFHNKLPLLTLKTLSVQYCNMCRNNKADATCCILWLSLIILGIQYAYTFWYHRSLVTLYTEKTEISVISVKSWLIVKPCLSQTTRHTCSARLWIAIDLDLCPPS